MLILAFEILFNVTHKIWLVQQKSFVGPTKKDFVGSTKLDLVASTKICLVGPTKNA